MDACFNERGYKVYVIVCNLEFFNNWEGKTTQ